MKLFLAALIFLSLAFVAPASAQESYNIISAAGPACQATGNCGLCDLVAIVIRLAKWVLGFTGGLALVFMLYGGWLLITSAGTSEKIEAGKKAVKGTVVAIVIIFFVAWFIPAIIVQVLTGKLETNVNATIFTSQSWFKSACGGEGAGECQNFPDGYPCGYKKPKEGPTGHCEKNDCKLQDPCTWAAEQAEKKIVEFAPLKGYTCMDPKTGANCLYGLCSGGIDKQCCLPQS